MPASSSNSTQTPKSIPSPLHLLILTPSTQSQATIPPLLQSLTGHAPFFSTSAGYVGYTTHPPLKLGTRYYEADVPVWVDEVPFTGLTADKPLYTATAETEQRPEREEEPIQASTSKSDNVSDSNSGSLQDWKQQFLSSEAAEVRAVIGGIVLVIQDQSATKEEADFEALKGVVEAVAEIRDAVEEERAGGECAGVLVLLPAQGGGKDGIGVEKWEEELLGAGVLGWDVVSWDPIDEGKEKENGTRNEYGELRGMERVREVLEANEWGSSLASGDGLEEIGLLSDDEGEVGFKLEANELEREMFGLRMAVEKTGEEVADEEDREELKVEELEGLMMKMQAIKDIGADMPEAERKRFAAEAVNDIMRSM